MTKRDSVGTGRKARGRLLRGTLRKRWKLGATCAGGNEVRSAALRSRTEPPRGSLTTVDRPSRARTWTSLPSCSAVINKRGEEVEEPERRAAAPEPAAGGWFWRVPSEEVGRTRRRRRLRGAAAVSHSRRPVPCIGPWWVGQKWKAGFVVCVLPDVGRFRPLVWQSPASKHGLSPAIAHIHPQPTGMRMDTPSGQWAVSHKVLLAPILV